METESANPNDGVQLARDLRQIRANRGMSFADVAEETRLPEGVLEAFERNILFDHPTFNQVYLRSVVRTYAAAVQIAEVDALDALEQALVGMYRGDLAKAYLEGDAATRAAVPPPHESTARTISSAPTPAEIAEATRQPGPTGVFVRRALVVRVIAIIAGLALIMLAIWLIRGLMEEPGDVAAPANDPPIPVAELPPPDEQIRTPIVERSVETSDSLDAVIRSLGRPVREIRIRVDRDLRRPYWIERDSILSLRFLDRIIIQEHDGLVEIDIPTLGYSSGRLSAGVPLVLTRARLNSLVGSVDADTQ